VQLKKNTDAEYVTVGSTRNQELIINTSGYNYGQNFDLRVRCISQNGTFSGFVSTSFANTPFLGGEYFNNVFPYPKQYMDDSISSVSSGAAAGTNLTTGNTIQNNNTGEI
jgi:hypothetical protein